MELKKIVIANRGEIAARIQRTCRKLNIESVILYSEADRNLPYVQNADIAYCLGEAPAKKSYLNQEKIIEIAKKEQADAIHPGYGFLSENASFVRAVEEAGLTFIGPSARVVEMMGDKVEARRTMKAAGVPIVPGHIEPVQTVDEALKMAEEIGYPVMLKASAGGGGIGIVKCEGPEALKKAFASSKKRAEAYFGSAEMFVEKFIANARHIEVQIFGDGQGNVIHLYERDCSVQRRNQKVIEETPSPFLTEETRQAICQAAVRAGESVHYKNAGTVEFVVDEKGNFYFLEMNTRLQVEHPITEETTGEDLVEWQIRQAEGKSLPKRQEEIKRRGHSIEFRLYAEDPEKFLPSPGTIHTFSYPEMDGVRIDSGFAAGNTITPYYDPLIAKIVVTASNRKGALEKAKRFFSQFNLTGIQSNAPLFKKILEEPAFVQGSYNTTFLQKKRN